MSPCFFGFVFSLFCRRERHFQQKKKKKKSRQKGVKERKGNASQLAPHEIENERKRGGASADKEHKRLKRSESKSLSNLAQITDSTVPMELAVSKSC
jgi:hypothetical protein